MKQRSGVFAVTVAVRFVVVMRAISPKKSPPLPTREVLPALRHLRRTVDDHEELAAERSLATQHGPRLDLEVLGDPRELGQLLLRQPLEERRALEGLDLHVLAEQTHRGQSRAVRLARVTSETRYAKSGDLRIAYQVHGDGPIDLVFAPGYISHLEQNQWWPAYATFFEKMASFSRLIVFDRRGTGLSDRILALGSFEELMDDIGVVLDAVGSERAALFGGAEGGPMCVLFAATFPERTSALVLGASYARRRWAPDYPWGLDEETQQRILDGYEERWGRIGFGARAIAPTLADDERFQDWYAQARVSRARRRPRASGFGSPWTSTSGTCFRPSASQLW